MTASDGTKNSDSIYVMDYLNGQTDSENSMATAFKNFQELTNGDAKSLKDKISTLYNAEIGNYLKSGDWCLDDKAYASTNDNATALTAQEIYKWRNFKYCTTVNRWAWRGAYESEYTKWRTSDNKYKFYR